MEKIPRQQLAKTTDKRREDVQLRPERLQEEAGDLKDLCGQLVKEARGSRKPQKSLSLTSVLIVMLGCSSHHERSFLKKLFKEAFSW